MAQKQTEDQFNPLTEQQSAQPPAQKIPTGTSQELDTPNEPLPTPNLVADVHEETTSDSNDNDYIPNWGSWGSGWGSGTHADDLGDLDYDPFGGPQIKVEDLKTAAEAASVPVINQGSVPLSPTEIDRTDDNGWTPLHHAVYQCKPLSVIKRLLAQGADPNALSKKSEENRENRWNRWSSDIPNGTPLHLAAFLSLKQISVALIDAGADVTLMNADGLRPDEMEVNPSSLRAQSFYDEIEVISSSKKLPYLTQKKAYIIGAIKEGKLGWLQDYVMHNPSWWGLPLNARQEMGLHVAIRSAHPNIVSKILTSLPISLRQRVINQANQNGDTPLHYAVKYTCKQSLKELLDRGADVQLTNKSGERADQLNIGLFGGNILREKINHLLRMKHRGNNAQIENEDRGLELLMLDERPQQLFIAAQKNKDKDKDKNKDKVLVASQSKTPAPLYEYYSAPQEPEYYRPWYEVLDHQLYWQEKPTLSDGLQYLGRLTELNLTGNPLARQPWYNILAPSDISSLAAMVSFLNQLTCLILNQCVLQSIDILELMQGLANHPSLVKLHLDYNPFGPAGHGHLAAGVATLPALTELSVMGTQMDTHGAEQLFDAFLKHTQLKQIRVEENPHVHSNVLGQLRSLPQWRYVPLAEITRPFVAKKWTGLPIATPSSNTFSHVSAEQQHLGRLHHWHYADACWQAYAKSAYDATVSLQEQRTLRKRHYHAVDLWQRNLKPKGKLWVFYQRLHQNFERVLVEALPVLATGLVEIKSQAPLELLGMVFSIVFGKLASVLGGLASGIPAMGEEFGTAVSKAIDMAVHALDQARKINCVSELDRLGVNKFFIGLAHQLALHVTMRYQSQIMALSKVPNQHVLVRAGRKATNGAQLSPLQLFADFICEKFIIRILGNKLELNEKHDITGENLLEHVLKLISTPHTGSYNVAIEAVQKVPNVLGFLNVNTQQTHEHQKNKTWQFRYILTQPGLVVSDPDGVVQGHLYVNAGNGGECTNMELYGVCFVTTAEIKLLFGPFFAAELDTSLPKTLFLAAPLDSAQRAAFDAAVKTEIEILATEIANLKEENKALNEKQQKSDEESAVLEEKVVLKAKTERSGKGKSNQENTENRSKNTDPENMQKKTILVVTDATLKEDKGNSKQQESDETKKVAKLETALTEAINEIKNLKKENTQLNSDIKEMKVQIAALMRNQNPSQIEANSNPFRPVFQPAAQAQSVVANAIGLVDNKEQDANLSANTTPEVHFS